MDVGFGDEHAFISLQAKSLTDGEESLDLLVHPSDGLDLTSLVHRSRNGEALLDRYA